jgi:formiminoglutamase
VSRLPLLLSVPHAGWQVPPEVGDLCILSHREIVEDGDEGAAEIYFGLEREVEAMVTTRIARAVIDMNRPEDDRGRDGVVKTHTCWDVPVYRTSLPEKAVAALLRRYHRPYHARLRALGKSNVLLGVDCHTMAAVGPPVGPDPGKQRPKVCLSNANGTCPAEWMDDLVACFQHTLDSPISVNTPFSGGHIIRLHSTELPWVQLELSRAPFLSDGEKQLRVLEALRLWSAKTLLRDRHE